ncbi:ribosomal protein S19E (S16A) [Marmoricola sp. OAE513]|uniref:winged helix DNA-binding domain-containing protein n=1 Tax=Marmoricola sp. OAE513 TaxID=2817894 RepID=UPI001AE87A0E
MQQISDDQRRARLAIRHGLAQRYADVASATAAMTCWHSTEPASVHLAAFARTGAGRDAVEAALYADRSIVKQLAMRRTVFAFPRDLLPAVWGSASARVAVMQQGQLARDVEKYGVAPDGAAWVAEACAAVLDHLRTHGPTTTLKLREALPVLDARMSVSPEQKWGAEISVAPRVLTTLAADGSVMRGENEGSWKSSRPRWTVTEDWLPGIGDALPEAEAYAVLVRSWLRTFGPGTENDVVWWLGATKAAVRRALADVEAVEVALGDGSVGYVLPDDLDEVEPVEPWAALLPALDPTTMGWKQRDFYLGEHAEKMFDRNGNGGPTAWWDGRVVGGWYQHDDGTVVVVPAEKLGAKATKALDERAAELTAWLGGDVVRSIYQSPLARAAAAVPVTSAGA